MEPFYIAKTCKDHNNSIECIRHYALQNDVKIRDLTHITVSKIPTSSLQILLKPQSGRITFLYVPLHEDFPYEIEEQPTLSELRTNQPTLLISFGNLIRRIPISAVSEKMLHTMKNNANKCCMCWDLMTVQHVKDEYHACSGCNVTWCASCNLKFEGKKFNVLMYVVWYLINLKSSFNNTNTRSIMERFFKGYTGCYFKMPQLSFKFRNY